MKAVDLLKQLGKKPEPVTDPVKHAREVTGKHYRITRSEGAFEPYASFLTTERFRGEEDGFHRHCGPTAISNLLLTFEKRKPVFPGRKLSPPRVFSRVAHLGMRKHYYLNKDVLGFYGGTFNLATTAYVKAAFAMYRRTDYRLRIMRPALKKALTDAIDRGAVLYLELVFHPLYGNHHALAYGYRLLTSEEGKTRLYLSVADGWSGEMRYIDAGHLELSRFLEIGITE